MRLLLLLPEHRQITRGRRTRLGFEIGFHEFGKRIEAWSEEDFGLSFSLVFEEVLLYFSYVLVKFVVGIAGV